MKQIGFVNMIVVAALCGVCGIQAGEAPASLEAPLMTFADLLKKGITQFIDKEFVIKARVAWEYASVKIPEDPTPDAELQKKASQLTIAVEGEEFRDNKRNKGLHASGRDLVMKADAQGRQVFAFKDAILSNKDKEYIMTVRLKLRPSFNKSHLENPAFVKQGNNPAYWNQTFEIEILALQAAP
jgi:hypothetical protein